MLAILFGTVCLEPDSQSSLASFNHLDIWQISLIEINETFQYSFPWQYFFHQINHKVGNVSKYSFNFIYLQILF